MATLNPFKALKIFAVTPLLAAGLLGALPAQADMLWLQSDTAFYPVSVLGRSAPSVNPPNLAQRGQIRPASQAAYQPAPDYHELAVWAAAGNEPVFNLYTLAIDGKPPKALTAFRQQAKSFVGTPLWSPDSRQLAFWRIADTDKSLPELWLAPRQGQPKKLYQASKPVGIESSPMRIGYAGVLWSPDSRSLLMQLNEKTNKGVQASLYQVDIQGGAPRRLLTQTANASASGQYHWLDQGRELAWLQPDGGQSYTLSGQPKRQIYWPTGWAPLSHYDPARLATWTISPDGRQLLLAKTLPPKVSNGPSELRGLACLNLLTGYWRILDEQLAQPQQAIWAGSDKIVLADSSKTLKVYDLALSTLTHLRLNLDTSLGLQPSPDGKRAALLAESGKKREIQWLQLQPPKLLGRTPLPAEPMILRAWVK